MSEPAQEPSSQAVDESQATATADEELLAALADEFAARLRRGEHPTVEEYAAEHPALAERIRKVLSAAAMMEQTRAWEVTAGGEAAGATIGRYKLLERIGEGGFGVVYMAEQQQPVRRKVALKVIKPGMDSRQVLARFEAERQALALMDHPNIAKIFDGGMTDSGRPYFVMELVRGQPITEFSDQHRLAPRERLELFAHVCHAVQHAHQKGIIHRDIKPSNMLVMLHDTTPVVKVIDFGVAKALGQELTDKTLFTGFAQFLGTPLYMSPEQAGESSLDVDTRSDIYSLGVLLYELLTGTTPFDKERFRQAAQDEIRRIIREEEPPKPSTRLSESKESLASISALRQTEPVKLTKLVRGELDWIVMKTLEKDRTRRYETANELAMDVQRYLNDDTVQACPPSFAYRLKKFVRRNKAALVTASVIGVALLIAVGSFGWAMRDRTARHAKAVGQIEVILAEVEELERGQKWPEALGAARRAEAVLAGGEVDAATARRVGERLKDLELVDRLEQIRMQQLTWVGIAFDIAGTDVRYARAFREYGVDVERLPVEQSIERLKARPLLAIPLAAALEDWDRSHWTTKRYAASSKRLVAVARGIDPDPLRDRVRASWGKPASEVGDELQKLAETIDVRAHHPATLSRLASNLRRVRRADVALRLQRAANDAYPQDFLLNYELAHRLADRNDHEGAIRFYTAAVAVRPSAVAARNNLGLALRGNGKADEAIGAFRSAIEIDPAFAPAYYNLGISLRGRGELDGAVAAYRKAIEHAPRFPGSYNNLGNVLSDDLAKYGEAIECYLKVIELDPKMVNAHANLGLAREKQGRLPEAIAAYEKALAIDPRFAPAIGSLARLLATCSEETFHDPRRALTLAQQAINLDPTNPDYHRTLGFAYYRIGDWKRATASLEKSLELRRGGNGSDWFFLAMAQWQLGNKDAAREWYGKAIQWMEKHAANAEIMIRLRAEAAKLLRLIEKQPGAPSTAPTTSPTSKK